MERYLRYLCSDIESSIGQAPIAEDWPSPFDDDDDDFNTATTSDVWLPTLLGIPATAFPPEHMLSDEQLAVLVPALNRLWRAWLLWWEMPSELSLRRQYVAFWREMHSVVPVEWHPRLGGTVKICDLEAEKPCPFGDGFCGCKDLEASAQHDLAIWEEHVRSQGLDPYRELTPDEEAAFEAEMQARNLRKQLGDDWDAFDFFIPDSASAEVDLFGEDDLHGFDEVLDWPVHDGDEEMNGLSDPDDGLDWDEFDQPF